MKQFSFILGILCLPAMAFCQDITGLWQGTLYNDSTKQNLPYEIVINKEKGKYTGFSLSCFLIDNKKYYGIKKVKINIAKDGKIVVQDDELINNNYPGGPDKNVRQLNVLNLNTTGSDAALDGPFVTNRTKQYSTLTGHVSLKQTSQPTESVLLQYLQKNEADGNYTVIK
jgi:hypothetical protein